MKHIYLASIIVIFLSACARTPTFETVHLGMSKEEMVLAAGHPDSVIAGNKVGDKMIEVFEYRKGNIWWGDLDESYWFFFADNKLEKWGRPHDHLRYVD